MYQNKIVINCRSEKSVHPELLKSLLVQIEPIDVLVYESDTHPTRLKHVQNQDTLYFFLDEDVSLPSSDYISKIRDEFNKNPQLLFLAGAYLNPPQVSYLTKCYNNLIRLWMQIDSSKCQNAPGGIWVVSGKILPYLKNWTEPSFWAGEDTYSIRYLQSKGVYVAHRSYADVYHHSQATLSHFVKRAWKQGAARSRYSLQSSYKTVDWNWILNNWKNWPGWGLHQVCVFLGSILSKTARTIPKSSPSA